MANPFHIMFCVEDAQVAAQGGVASVTARLIQESENALLQAGFAPVGSGHYPDLGNGFHSLSFSDVSLAVLWQSIDRADDREQWSVAFWSTPQFDDLAPAQRAELARVHSLIALHVAKQPYIAEVNVALPVGFAVPSPDAVETTRRAH